MGGDLRSSSPLDKRGGGWGDEWFPANDWLDKAAIDLKEGRTPSFVFGGHESQAAEGLYGAGDRAFNRSRSPLKKGKEVVSRRFSERCRGGGRGGSTVAAAASFGRGNSNSERQVRGGLTPSSSPRKIIHQIDKPARVSSSSEPARVSSSSGAEERQLVLYDEAAAADGAEDEDSAMVVFGSCVLDKDSRVLDDKDGSNVAEFLVDGYVLPSLQRPFGCESGIPNPSWESLRCSSYVPLGFFWCCVASRETVDTMVMEDGAFSQRDVICNANVCVNAASRFCFNSTRPSSNYSLAATIGARDHQQNSQGVADEMRMEDDAQFWKREYPGLAINPHPPPLRQNAGPGPKQPTPPGPWGNPNGHVNRDSQTRARVPFDVEEDVVDYVNVEDETAMDDEVAEVFVSRFDCSLIGRLLGQRLPPHRLSWELHRKGD